MNYDFILSSEDFELHLTQHMIIINIKSEGLSSLEDKTKSGLLSALEGIEAHNLIHCLLKFRSCKI